MSLTSYRAAPPRVTENALVCAAVAKRNTFDNNLKSFVIFACPRKGREYAPRIVSADTIRAERAFGDGTRHEHPFETRKPTDTVRTRNRCPSNVQSLSGTALSALIAPVPAIHKETRREHLADRK
jgi:hypothetical protein